MKKSLIIFLTISIAIVSNAQNTNIQDLSGRHADYYYSIPWLGDSTMSFCRTKCHLGGWVGEFAPEHDGVYLFNTQVPLPLKGIAIVGTPRSTGPLSDCVLNLYSYDYVRDKRELLSTTEPFNPHDSVGVYGINIINYMWGGPSYIDRNNLGISHLRCHGIGSGERGRDDD